MKKVKKFLSDNWLVISLAVLPSLGLWFFLQREVHDLRVDVVANTSVVSLAEGFTDDIEVFYKSQKIESLNVIDVRMANTGNKAIEKGDFETAIMIEFSGEILAKPNVLEANPSSLSPVIQVTERKKALVQPLLLNEDDFFITRYYVTDLNVGDDLIKVNARIKNIKRVFVDMASIETDRGMSAFVVGILSSLLASVSVAAGLVVARRARLVLRISGVPDIVLEVSRKLESQPEVVSHAEELASQLKVKGHDYKSNFLLLRLKIESLLRELAISTDLPPKMQRGSINRISLALEERQVISHDIASAIRDLSPTMNRELHEIETYVSDEQFKRLHQLGLNIVATLDSIVEKIKVEKPEQAAKPTSNV